MPGMIATVAVKAGQKVTKGSPLLSVERVSFSYADKPVEWRRGLYATSEHCYFNELG